MPTLTRGAAKAVSTLFFRGKNCGLALGLLGVSAVPDLAQAQGFLKDSHGTLTLRNYYMDRDYKDDGAKTATREWAQGSLSTPNPASQKDRWASVLMRERWWV